MKRLVLLLTLFLIWPLTVYAQIVSPGGGANIFGGTGIVGGSCTAPQVMNGIDPTGVPSCVTPAGIPLPVSIANGGTGGGTAPTVGQLLVAQSATVFAPMSLSGDVTITNAGVVTVNSVNGVTGPFPPLNTSAGPTAPATPVTGQQWYNTTNNTLNVWNGTAWVPISGGAFTPPDGSTWSATGLSGVASLSVNGNTGLLGQLAVTGNTTLGGTLTVSNSTTLAAVNITGNANISNALVTGVMNFATGSGLYFNGNPMGGTCAANQFVNALSNTGVPTCAAVSGGGTSVGATPPATPVEGQMWFNSTDLQTYVYYGGQWVPVVNIGGSAGAVPPSGSTIDSPTFTGTVTMPAATVLNVAGTSTFTGTMTFPDGSTYTTAGHQNMKALGIGQATGVYGYPLEITGTNNGDTGINILNGDPGANASTSIYVWNGTSSLDLQQSGVNNSLGGRTNGASIISTGGPELDFMTTNGTAPFSPINILTPAFSGQFHSSPWVGLVIPTNTQTGLQVGDMTISSVGAANFNLVAGAYYDGANWIATSNVPSYELINAVAGAGLGFYISSGARAPGQTLAPWNQQLIVGGTGIFFNHMGVDQTTQEPAPSVTNGTIMGGSSDAFGMIQASAWPVTLTYGLRFVGSGVCVATGGAGQIGVLATTNQSPTNIQFVCENWGNDPAAGNCPTPFWFTYMCADLAYTGPLQGQAVAKLSRPTISPTPMPSRTPTPKFTITPMLGPRMPSSTPTAKKK